MNLLKYLIVFTSIIGLISCGDEPNVEIYRDGQVLCPGNIWIDAKTSFTQDELATLLQNHTWEFSTSCQRSYAVDKKKGAYYPKQNEKNDLDDAYVVYYFFLTENLMVPGYKDIENSRQFYLDHPEECIAYHLEGNVICFDDKNKSRYTVIGYTDKTIFYEYGGLRRVMGELPY